MQEKMEERIIPLHFHKDWVDQEWLQNKSFSFGQSVAQFQKAQLVVLLKFSFTYVSIQATTALAETTAIADFRGLTIFSAIYVVYCIW